MNINKVCIKCFQMKPTREMVLSVKQGVYTCNKCKDDKQKTN